MTQDMNHTIVNGLRAVLMGALMFVTGTNAMAQESSETPTGVVVHGNVYGGGNQAGVLVNTAVNMSTGKVEGNVYGGGNVGDVGTHVDQATPSVGNYAWKDQDGNDITNNTAENKLTGFSKVTITGGTVGVENPAKPKEHGNVFGGGKGEATTFECEKGMVYKTNVSIKISGTTNTLVYRNVYGGGEVSRVENDTEVTIGTASGEDEPIIKGSVFAAGAGVETHGYSALVRGHSTVTVQGKATVEHNVYGGGELASVGRYKVKTPANENEEGVPKSLPYGMPAFLMNGGTSTVVIQVGATIGGDGTANTGHVYGAGKGLEPREYDYASGVEGENDYHIDEHQPKRMNKVNGIDTWEYFATEAAYLQYVETLALSAKTDVTINGSNVTVKGSVFGGSESGFVYHNTDVEIQAGTIEGDAYGGGRGLESFAEAGRVRGNTKLTVSGGAVEGNVYGGGNLGDVGTIDKSDPDYNYEWKNSEANGNIFTPFLDNTAHNNEITDNNTNTGICEVIISGGRIGSTTAGGHVFGAGQGKAITWWCEKAIVYATNVTVSGGEIHGNVYGGGQVGRVEDDAKVVIGVADATGAATPTISGSVFGAGAGLHTHGYSALVRGNSDVTVQGTAQIGGSVYGGGQIASVGKFHVVGGLPSKPKSGGTCIVNIKDNAHIGTSGTDHNVFGACKGVDPATVTDRKSMQLYQNRPKQIDSEGNIEINQDTGKEVLEGESWDYYEDHRFVWVYYSKDDYPDFLKTLALTSNPHVTISENATVYGDVYGGGERGVTLGKVEVDITGGTVTQDVYGGGSLADTNTANWEGNALVSSYPYHEETMITRPGYQKKNVPVGESVEGLYTKSGNDYNPANDVAVQGTDYYKPFQGASVTGLYTRTGSEGNYTYTKITGANATADASTTYYALYTTTVNLLGGTICGNAYGGGLGRFASNTESLVEAKVYGETKVNLNGMTVGEKSAAPTSIQNLLATTAIDGNGDNDRTDTDDDYYTVSSKGCIVNQIFGCNNLKGSPQGNVTVHVFATQNKDASKTTVGAHFTSDKEIDETLKDASTTVEELKAILADQIAVAKKISVTTTTYETLYNDEGATVDQLKENIPKLTKAISDAADTDAEKATINALRYDMEAVYGGGNESPYVPVYNAATGATDFKTQVIIEGCEYTSIETVYGGGNAASVPETNVTIKAAYEIETVFGGGNGNEETDHFKPNPGADIGTYKNASDVEVTYGTGNANTTITGGYIHEAYGGSNERGTIMGTVNLTSNAGTACDMLVKKMVTAGKNADIMGDAITILGCMPDSWVEEYYGGADNANVHGNVELTITSGNFRKVFGGNNRGGIIMGHIKVNIEETGCTPIIIDELYLGGNQAAYSVYGYYKGQYYQNEGNYYLDAAHEIPLYQDNDGNLYLDAAKNKRLYKKDGETYLYLDGEYQKPLYRPRTSASDGTAVFFGNGGENDHTKAPYDDPELNIISCTRIGKVFGGGLGEGAVIYGSPTVNINQIVGKQADANNPGSYIAATELGQIGVNANGTTTDCGVFGGGNQAKVVGNTTVNIGTKTTVDLHQSVNASGVYTLLQNQTVLGAKILSNVYGGGNQADVTGNTFVNICAVKSGDTYNAVAEGTKKVIIGGNVFGGGKGIADNYFCDKAMVGTDKAGETAGYLDGNTSVIIGNGTVGTLENGKLKEGTGSVYGGGEVGRVEMNTTVTIGLPDGGTSSPDIKGDVFGGGKGEKEHGYAALVRGNPTVTIQANAKVEHNVYGGGEIASVARYKVPLDDADLAAAHSEGYTDAVIGRPYALKDAKSGFCTVTVKGNAVIGPDTPLKMYHVDSNGNIPDTDTPDDAGHVFGAGKGIMPENYDYVSNTVEHKPRCRAKDNSWTWFGGVDEYIAFIQTLALSSQTTVTIGDDTDSNCKPFIKGSVYGGSENGLVQFNTNVNIESGQIGWGKDAQDNAQGAYGDDVWADNYTPSEAIDLECPHWDYGIEEGEGTNKKKIYAPYDPNANATGDLDKYPPITGQTVGKSTEGGRKVASDGHTYYGNVFGGGSGSVPYFDTTTGVSRYIMSAGWVKGNTNVTISGGHILTNVYGGNEATNVDGTATVTMTGGTIGVPRTLQQIVDHPVTCYLFGAGKGDQRVFFNKDTNVKDVVVNLTGGRIYGSVFGGGEDGHVLRDVTMTIGTAATAAVGTEGEDGYQPAVAASGPTIGTWGTSYVDGNVFGGGRGFGGDAYTAGNVAGSVTMNINGGEMLGSIYGGGRLGSVGYGLYEATEIETDGHKMYGEMQDDGYGDWYKDKNEQYTRDAITNFKRGHIDITISGGTIGNDWEFVNVPTDITESGLAAWKTTNHVPYTEYETTTETIEENSTTTTLYHHRLKHTKGGNVFAGGMGRFYQLDGSTYISSIDWWKLGCVKSTKLTITGGTIKSNVYGGGELGQVVGHHTTNDDKLSTEISISGNNTQIGTEVKNGETTEYTFGSVFGSGYGSLIQSITVNGTTSYPRLVAGLVKEDTKIDMQGGAVKASIYGGGEMASVGESTTSGTTTTATGSTHVSVGGGTVGIEPITVSGETRYFGGAKMGNVYGGGSGDNGTVRSGKIFKNTNVNISGGTIYHNVYGGGAYGTVGDFNYTQDENNDNKVTGVNGLATEGTGVANVTIIGGTIGYDGRENGMVFGSSRGDIAEPGARDDFCAWVYDTHVTIGSLAEGTEGQEGYVPATAPQIKGSVYGSGENGHTFNNTEVIIHSGTVGIEDGWPINGLSGANYPTRGNVYGGGCGTDTYEVDHDNNPNTPSKQYFNRLSGIVRGNTSVTMDGGHVVRSIYGGGAMGSVGVFTRSDDDDDGIHLPGSITGISFGGKCTVNISGGKVGPATLTMPMNAGMVFGAGRGEVHDVAFYPNLERVVYVNETDVTISGTAFVKGSVYGGAESGHVFGNTHVTIDGDCQIGCGYDKTFNNGEGKEPGKDLDRVYNSQEWAYNVTADDSKFLYECNSWPFQAPYAPYDKFADENGKYSDGSPADNAQPTGSDGHTFYGNVFGGGSGYEPYAPGKWLPTAGWVQGNTLVEIKGGHILTSVYGGNEMSDVGSGGVQKMTDLNHETSDMFYDIRKPGGKCTVKMSGGTLGVPRTLAQIAAHPLTCYLFGAGKGDQRIFFNKTTNVKEVEIEISGGRIFGSVFGGGEDGHVMRDVKMTIKDGSTTTGEGEQAVTTTTSPIIGTWGTSYVDGNVFGGGRGFSGEALTAGNVGGSVNIDIQGGKMLGSIYGGGRLGSVGYGLYLVDEEINGVKPYGDLRDHNVDDRGNTVDDFKRGYITINISGGTIGNDIEYKYNPTDADKLKMPTTQFDYQKHLTYTRGGNVFTGCMGRLYALDNSTLLPLWTKLGRCKQTVLNITGGTIKSNVYGGAELGVVQKDATVNITGGTVGTKVGEGENAYYYGSVFGSGKGSNDAITYPEGTAEAADISEAGTVEGNVTVELNNGVAVGAKGGVVHKIFGCNDMNGTPKGTVTVHVYATQKEDGATINDKAAKAATAEDGTYDVEAVYGGGNLAAYVPTKAVSGSDAEKELARPEVIIDGCGLTSIGTVYGGGNAASVPATNVTVNGTYEIGQVFGGGNGKDKLPSGSDNPGANVGYYSYPNATNAAYDTKEDRIANYAYGSGKTHVTIYRGTVHEVYGGSNSRGNVYKEARATLEDLSTLPEDRDCPFDVTEAYGGGRNAPMDGDAVLEIGCISGLGKAYGGAANADVNGNVVLNITNGTYGQVFGGNDLGGNITGSITVNIEETGCRPVIIGELYGGGNLAGYSIYGYKKVTETDETTGELVQVWRPRESSTDSPAGVELSIPATIPESPQVNVKSFTSIGTVYGGGYGGPATMVGSPEVNINVFKGKYAETYNGNDNVIKDNARIVGSTVTTNASLSGYGSGYPVPSHAKGAIGAINNVFGGGNAAKVIGTPHVNIGTLTGEVITLASKPIEDSEGKAPTDEGWIPSYQLATVKGVDIRGNVYGAGNNALVTGDTEVVIGKNNNVKTYCFRSFGSESGDDAWSSGLAQTTGNFVTLNNGSKLAEVVILSNGKYTDFVGQKFYVAPDAPTDGTRTQLWDESGGETGLWVAISEQKIYNFTSSNESGSTTYSEGTAIPTGNFKVISVGGNNTECMQIQVLTNPGDTSWEGRTFYVPVNAETDGTTRTQLRDANGGGVGVWVSISEAKEGD